MHKVIKISAGKNWNESLHINGVPACLITDCFFCLINGLVIYSCRKNEEEQTPGKCRALEKNDKGMGEYTLG